MTIKWTDYLRYRAETRGFDLDELESILRFSTERYRDTETGRIVKVGRHQDQLVLIPYDEADDEVTPVTVHATTRQQINMRLTTGRFEIE